jgi:Family of unknown function (DUF6527)
MPRWLILFLIWLGLVERPRFLTRYATAHPKVSELAESDFVIVRAGNLTKWACFLCPCGCGKKIALSLVKERRPLWQVAVDWLWRPTVSPSVWQRAGCYSHFWIKKGAVEWCAGSGTAPRQAA